MNKSKAISADKGSDYGGLWNYRDLEDVEFAKDDDYNELWQPK